MKVRIWKIVEETAQAKSFYFEPVNFFKNYPYKSGQFVTIELSINEKTHRRAYSISSSPHQKDTRFTVKRVENGLVSNYLNDNIKKGDTLELLPATGAFIYEPQKKKEEQYIHFAAGSGVTPVHSILKNILYNEPQSKNLLFYANTIPQGIIFKDELDKLLEEFPDRIFVKHILVEDHEKIPEAAKGFLSTELVQETVLEHGFNPLQATYFLCGPIGYMENVDKALESIGVDYNRILRERFELPKITLKGKNLLSDVTVSYGNESYQTQVRGNETILQSLINKNISVPFSCRSGQCSTCKAKCKSGSVRMIEGNVLSQKEIDEGSILTCVSYPTSSTVEIELTPERDFAPDFSGEGKGSTPVKTSRKRQLIGGALGLLIGLIGLFFLSSKPGESARSLGPMNVGHEDLSCVTCHSEAEGNIMQQLSSNVQFLFRMRKSATDFGTSDVVNKNCIECHNRPNDRHPTSRFSEPKFAEAITVIDARECSTCHQEHNDTRTVLPDGNYCINCHSELEVIDDPIDVPHEDLIAAGNWESCMQCHDFHGNHIYEVPELMKDTIPLMRVMEYLRGGEDPYLGKKAEYPLSEEEWEKK